MDESKLRIVPIKTRAKELPQPKEMAKRGIKHPFSCMIVGSSGSGKTTVGANMLRNKKMFYKYFHKVYLFSQTAGMDPTLQALKIPKEQIISKDMLENLENLVKNCEFDMEESGGKIQNTDRVCVIFEDATAMPKKFLNSEAMLKCFCQNRHLNMSSIFIVHKYKAMPRTCRLQANHIFFFPGTNSEKKALMENVNSPRYPSKKEFELMLDEAFRPEKNNIKPFLHANMKAKLEERFRKSFDSILDYDNGLTKRPL